MNNGAAQSNLGYGGFYIDGTDAAHFVGNNLTDPLGSGASRTLFNGFNTSNLSVGQHTLFVGADNFGQTAESNETQQLAGDYLYGDGAAGERFLAHQLGRHVGCEQSGHHSRWNGGRAVVAASRVDDHPLKLILSDGRQNVERKARGKGLIAGQKLDASIH